MAYGNPAAWAFPQIYRNDGIMADQWREISEQAVHDGKPKIGFQGALTQWKRCNDNSGCDQTLDNTPLQGWTQLYESINGDPETTGDVWLSSDMRAFVGG